VITIVKFLNNFIVFSMRENISCTHFRPKKIIGRGGGSNPRPPENPVKSVNHLYRYHAFGVLGRVIAHSMRNTLEMIPTCGTKIARDPGKKLWPKNLAKKSIFTHYTTKTPHEALRSHFSQKLQRITHRMSYHSPRSKTIEYMNLILLDLLPPACPYIYYN